MIALFDPSCDKEPRLFFVDEMRYGLMSNFRRSWSLIGQRAVLPQQQAFLSRYLYSAIDPITGESFHIMDFDRVNTLTTQLFLSELQKMFPEYHLIIVWDNAGFHKSKTLEHEDRTLCFLPSYSPQLNPVERFFEECRKITANLIFPEGIDQLSDILEKGIVELAKDMQTIQRLCGYDWIREQYNSIIQQVKAK